MSASGQPPHRVWIDTDPAVGVPGCDVDDGYAILQALRSPELDVVGISTVFGNAPVDAAHPIAAELLQVAGAPQVPLYRGAAGAQERGSPTPASEALARALADARLTVLALGPLTNVATLLLTHPEVADEMTEVVAVAGRRPGQRFMVGEQGPLPDFNFECDPESVEMLLAADVTVTLTGFEVATHVLLTPAHLERLRAGPPAARWLAERSDGWLGFWAEHLGVAGFHPFDTLAVGVLVVPELVEREETQAAMIRGLPAELDYRGRTPTGSELHVVASLPGGRPVRYASAAREGFAEDLVARLLRP